MLSQTEGQEYTPEPLPEWNQARAPIIVNTILILFLQPADTAETAAVDFDETASSRLNALQQVVMICTRNLLK